MTTENRLVQSITETLHGLPEIDRLALIAVARKIRLVEHDTTLALLSQGVAEDDYSALYAYLDTLEG